MHFPQTAKRNLAPLTQGDDSGYKLEFTKGGQPVDISGWDIIFTAKRERGGAVAIQNTATITDAAGGIAEIRPDAANTTDLSGLYYYDIEVDTGSEVRTIMSGIVPFEQDVTE